MHRPENKTRRPSDRNAYDRGQKECPVLRGLSANQPEYSDTTGVQSKPSERM